MTEKTPLPALGSISELLAERDAAHLFAGVISVLGPHFTEIPRLKEHHPQLPVADLIHLIRLFDRVVDLHTGNILADLLGRVRPYLAPPSAPVEVPLGDGSGETLTAAELTVLSMIASGHTNRSIAEQLHMSEDGVKSRLSGVFRKFGVESRAHAVAMAFRLGLLTVPARIAV